MKHYLAPMLTALTLSGMGCDASVEPEVGAQDPAGSGGDTSCALDNQTRQCSCGLLTGRQTCLGSKWSQCQCFSVDSGLVTEQGNQLVGDGQSSAVAPSGNQREDLVFDWLRTPPSAGSCMPGHYEGTFECLLSDGTNDWGLVTGPVVIVLEKSKIDGEYLEIADGNMDGFVEQWMSPISAKLEGRLDCTSRKFEANTVDGQYLMISFMPGPFNGVLEGKYNRLTWHLSGEWHLIDDFHVGFNCAGPWHVDFVGP